MESQPSPRVLGQVIPDLLIAFLEGKNTMRAFDSVIQLIQERDAFGRAKYGQPLMSEDGRDGVQDAKEELGDLMQYAFKAMLNQRDVTDLREMVAALLFLLNSEDDIRGLGNK